MAWSLIPRAQVLAAADIIIMDELSFISDLLVILLVICICNSMLLIWSIKPNLQMGYLIIRDEIGFAMLVATQNKSMSDMYQKNWAG